MKHIIKIVLLSISTFINAQTELNSEKVRLINYTSRYSAGFLGGDSYSNSFLTQQGISISPYFSTTLTLGLEKYYYQRYSPILIDFKYTLLKKNTSPYLKFFSGYLLDIERNGQAMSENYGVTVGGGVGIKTRLNNKLSVFTEIGYRYSQLERLKYYGYGGHFWQEQSPIIETHTNRLELRIGIEIN